MSAHAKALPYRRLTGREINLLRFLAMHALKLSGMAGVMLSRRDRGLAAPLWRRGLINCWYRQAPETTPSLQGPYFSLSHAGLRLAEKFTRPSGARARS